MLLTYFCALISSTFFCVSRYPMTEQNDIKTFDELSEKYSTWIIKYCSEAFDSPLFLVWYTDTDENSTDRLLTYKSGEIFAIKSLNKLKTTISSSVDNLIEFENLSSWLNNFNNLEVKENCTYDLILITNEIDKTNLDISIIEGLASFINLYGDFINQDEKNTRLQVYADNQLIKETWDYYYEYIFWPRFNDKEKFEAWDRPQLVIDTQELLLKLKDIIKTFDDNIKHTEKAIC
jgi:hypothetical protein